jgi:hypothetical protein
MKLVLAKTHIFARWDGFKTGERFNIEGTNAQFADHPDSYYRNWPDKITNEEMKRGWYLKPLTPAEELTVFLHNRGCCLMDNGRFAEAKAAFAVAARLAPQDPLGPVRIASASEAMRPVRVLRSRSLPAGLPVGNYRYGMPPEPGDPLDEVDRMIAIDRANRERMRPPEPPQPPNPYGSYSPPNPYEPQPPYQAGRP